MTDVLAKALLAPEPAAYRADKLALYGRFVGSWVMDAVTYRDDGTTRTGQGEIHFGWVLAGRAVQDVWVLPGIFHGTTLRIYDPGIDAWHILWSDPVRQYYSRQIGRAVGDRIVQEGKNDTGLAVRWSFNDITPRAFRWLGECSFDGGRSWQVQSEYHARRRG